LFPNWNNASDAIDHLNLRRYCCRRMVLTHVDLIEKLLKYVPTEERAEERRKLEREVAAKDRLRNLELNREIRASRASSRK
jgi:DNA-directed RNA polymerases I, II, and III subunit RPABC5